MIKLVLLIAVMAVIAMLQVGSELHSIRVIMETMEKHYGQVSKGP